jgi:DNA-binding transcriptional LysR family regulator
MGKEVQRKESQGGSTRRHEPEEKSSSIRLDDIQIFVEVARHGSARKAAQALSKGHAYINRRLQILEQQTGHELFLRDNSGTSLTDQGRALLRSAEGFVEESSNVLGFINQQMRQKKKTSSVVVTEGLGTFWLMPRLVEFNQGHPDIFLDFQCQMKPANLSDYGADIAVQLEYPEDENLIVSRIGYLHIMLFASNSYANEHGLPETLQDLPNFHLIEQKSDQVDASRYIDTISRFSNNPVSMRMNTSSAHAYAISRGAGIGPLPTYARALTKRLIPVCDDYHIRRDVFLVHNRETTKSLHHRKVIAWIKEAFDASEYPWFGADFIHPNEFEDKVGHGNIVQMFDGDDV